MNVSGSAGSAASLAIEGGEDRGGGPINKLPSEILRQIADHAGLDGRRTMRLISRRLRASTQHRDKPDSIERYLKQVLADKRWLPKPLGPFTRGAEFHVAMQHAEEERRQEKLLSGILSGILECAKEHRANLYIKALQAGLSPYNKDILEKDILVLKEEDQSKVRHEINKPLLIEDGGLEELQRSMSMQRQHYNDEINLINIRKTVDISLNMCENIMNLLR